MQLALVGSRQRWCVIAAVALVVWMVSVLARHPVAADEVPATDLRATMHEIFTALSTVLPLSLHEQQFRAAAQRQHILEALRTLANNAATLAEHSQALGPSYSFLRHSLVADAQEVVQRYEGQDFEGARFALQELTENCFACHTRLPSQRRFDLGKRFLATVDLTSLPFEDRIRLAVATRQFDVALTASEALFRSAELAAADIDLMGAFENYLKIVIRVHGDYGRAIATLKTFQQRPDTPYYLSALLQTWVEALESLRSRPTTGDTLQAVRQLMREARLRNRFPADRRGLVHFIAASSRLLRYVDSDVTTVAQAVEAYYLLGVTESYISHTQWLSETEFFLETAIRLAPSSPFARKAYAFLEEYVLTGYSGSSGLHVPPDVQAHLAELRALIDGGQAQ